MGVLSCAATAGPPSPVLPATPMPATVVMSPVAASTLLILCWPLSAMNRDPFLSRVRPVGYSSPAEVAGALSPMNACVPMPAIVLMSSGMQPAQAQRTSRAAQNQPTGVPCVCAVKDKLHMIRCTWTREYTDCPSVQAP